MCTTNIEKGNNLTGKRFDYFLTAILKWGRVKWGETSHEKVEREKVERSNKIGQLRGRSQLGRICRASPKLDLKSVLTNSALF